MHVDTEEEREFPQTLGSGSSEVLAQFFTVSPSCLALVADLWSHNLTGEVHSSQTVEDETSSVTTPHNMKSNIPVPHFQECSDNPSR